MKKKRLTPGAPKKKIKDLRKSFCLSFDPIVFADLDKLRGLIPRSLFIEQLVVDCLKRKK